MSKTSNDAAAPKAKRTAVDALYNVMQSIENKLGGGEGVEGLYGSITQGGTQKVLDCLFHNCGLGPKSTLVDIGAGLGRPLLHALIQPGVKSAFGIELDAVKVQKAEAFGRQSLQALHKRQLLNGAADGSYDGSSGRITPPPVYCSSIEQVESLEPATHAYSFWEGVPASGKAAFGKLFAQSKSLKKGTWQILHHLDCAQAVAVVQRAMRKGEPASVMHTLGFGPLLLIASFPVSMSGSGRSFTAYIFSKVNSNSAALLQSLIPSTAKPLAANIPAKPAAPLHSNNTAVAAASCIDLTESGASAAASAAEIFVISCDDSAAAAIDADGGDDTCEIRSYGSSNCSALPARRSKSCIGSSVVAAAAVGGAARKAVAHSVVAARDGGEEAVVEMQSPRGGNRRVSDVEAQDGSPSKKTRVAGVCTTASAEQPQQPQQHRSAGRHHSSQPGPAQQQGAAAASSRKQAAQRTMVNAFNTTAKVVAGAKSSIGSSMARKASKQAGALQQQLADAEPGFGLGGLAHGATEVQVVVAPVVRMSGRLAAARALRE